MFLGKGAGQGLLLRGVAGQQEAAEPATADDKFCAAGQILYEGEPPSLPFQVKMTYWVHFIYFTFS